MNPVVSSTLSRRSFLAGIAGGATLLALGSSGPAAHASGATKHLAWVWRFTEDGSPEFIRKVLADAGMGILFKTHDGTKWQNPSSRPFGSISSAEDVGPVARFFEEAGVPFHAWSVVKGLDPVGEARMTSEVLDAGARSMTFDLEPKEGTNYWQASFDAANAFGAELRRLQPNAWLGVAPDPRPWQLDRVPIHEFASFVNEISPQSYWKMFDSPTNYKLLRQRGFDIGAEGMTPELVLDMTQHALAPFGLPIRPIGWGPADLDGWSRFVSHARQLGMQPASVWRFGTATSDLWPMLRPPAADPVVAVTEVEAKRAPHEQPGIIGRLLRTSRARYTGS